MVLRRYVSLAAVVLVLLFSPAMEAHAAAPAVFKVGESAAANTVLPIWMAQDAGFYRDRGLNVEIVPMAGGARSGPELESGHLQVMHIGLSSIVRAAAAGGRLKIIGSLSNVIRMTMFAAPGIRTAVELKGGIVGISSAGSESDSAMTLALRRLGLTRQDVTVRAIGVARLGQLRMGVVTATMLGEPERSQAFADGLTPLADLYAERIPWLFTGLAVDGAYLRAHRDLLERFLEATIEGNYLALSDAKRAKTVLARELKLTDAKIIDASYANFKAETPPNAEIDRQGAQNVVMAVAGPNSGRKAEDYIDTSLLDGLRDQGFFARMERKYGKP